MLIDGSNMIFFVCFEYFLWVLMIARAFFFWMNCIKFQEISTECDTTTKDWRSFDTYHNSHTHWIRNADGLGPCYVNIVVQNWQNGRIHHKCTTTVVWDCLATSCSIFANFFFLDNQPTLDVPWHSNQTFSWQFLASFYAKKKYFTNTFTLGYLTETCTFVANWAYFSVLATWLLQKPQNQLKACCFPSPYFLLFCRAQIWPQNWPTWWHNRHLHTTFKLKFCQLSRRARHGSSFSFIFFFSTPTTEKTTRKRATTDSPFSSKNQVWQTHSRRSRRHLKRQKNAKWDTRTKRCCCAAQPLGLKVVSKLSPPLTVAHFRQTLTLGVTRWDRYAHSH